MENKHRKDMNRQIKRSKKRREAELAEVYENEKKEVKEWKKSQLSFLEFLTEELRLPPDVIVGNPVVRMQGRNKVLIENYKKLMDYTDTKIRILTGIGKINILGRNLRILFYTRDEIKIVGTIRCVDLSGGEHEASD